MAIASLKPTTPPTIPLQSTKVQKETYLGIVADNDTTPLQSLQAYLDGMPWTVHAYYSQLLGKHNDLRELDDGGSPAYQQYQKIRELQLRVDSALQTSYDSEKGITEVTGSAIILHLVPNINDCFVAEAGSRQNGIYRIKTVERRVFNRDSVYLVSYELLGYVADQPERYQDLESKVVRTYHFSIGRLADGLAPVLREEDYALSQDLAHDQHRILQHYFQRFFNRSQHTLMVPGQTRRIYDPRLVNFLMSIVDSSAIPECRELKRVSMDNERYLSAPSLWTALVNRDWTEIQRCLQQAGVINTGGFNRSSWIKTAIYWPVDGFVYPITDRDDSAVAGDPLPMVTSGWNLDRTDWEADPEKVAVNQYVSGTETLPLIKPVSEDNFYVLSESFYTGQIDLSMLEVLTRDYLKHATIDQAGLKALTTAYFNWPVLEQFYYAPILVLLIRESVRGFYK